MKRTNRSAPQSADPYDGVKTPAQVVQRFVARAAHVLGKSESELLADARLAGAAPELLTAAANRAAIAKATGDKR